MRMMRRRSPLAPHQVDRPGAARQSQPVAADDGNGHHLVEDRTGLGLECHVGAGHAGRDQRSRVERRAGLAVGAADRVAAELGGDPSAVEVDMIIALARDRAAVDPSHPPAGPLERRHRTGQRRYHVGIAALVDLEKKRGRRAAAAVQPLVDRDLDRVGVGAIAHPVAAP